MNASNRNPALFAAIGLLTAFFFAVVWIVAAENDPSWVLGEDTISELGISSVDLTADLFMYGCVIAGILTFVFGMGKAYVEDDCSRASGILVGIAGLFLILVGMYDMNYGNGNVHDTVTYLFFIFLALGAILSVFGDWSEGKRVSAIIAAVLILVVIAMAVGKSLAYVEAVAVACGILWMISESVKMILGVQNGNPVTVKGVA